MVGARIARESISPVERLTICLRFLSTGDSYSTSGFSFRVGRSPVAGIVPSVAQAIWDCLVGEYMPVPKEEDWRAIAAEFLERWNFPNCLGSIDGKHVVIQAPPCSGSQFYNYKGTYSVVLLAVVDAIYYFCVVDVGAYGKGRDGGTLRDSAFGQALQDGTLEIPPSLTGAEDLGPVPHVFVDDKAFPLRPNLMRPYTGRQLPLPKPVRIFNKRLSGARLVVECTFGILAARWRMYWRVLGLILSNVNACVKATCVVYNYLRRSFQEPFGMEMGTPNGHLPDV
ncbi:protein ALP1-like isoform X1 [Oncorhynchus tshawytscha]|uniref:DDE Tnp4 domain-containing protein n=1 Tax=Oncorhynchus tshawytscha TaxID=74940 RepID=A0AAZ3SIA7_ONCTS|nr:protein ALP1-like isoform X1 [Oncorhynchus tshawytscha]